MKYGICWKKLFPTSLFISSFYVDVKFSIILLYWIMLTFPYEIFIPQSWNIFLFLLFPENVPLIFYCTILWKKGHEALLSLHFSRPQKKKNKMCQQYIYSFRHFYVSSAFSPCVFRIKIRFCQFSLQGKNKKAKWYCQTTKCFLIYNPYFINKD